MSHLGIISILVVILNGMYLYISAGAFKLYKYGPF